MFFGVRIPSSARFCLRPLSSLFCSFHYGLRLSSSFKDDFLCFSFSWFQRFTPQYIANLFNPFLSQCLFPSLDTFQFLNLQSEGEFRDVLEF